MDGQGSSLKVPMSLSATSSAGRNKVALKPARSLMDWIRFSNTAKDLSSTGGKILEITPRELAKHNSVKDAWIALRGKVYNITHYLEYHPGGEEELMRGAGKDATDLFNQVHRWVNAESMLQKCLVGVLKTSWTFDVPKLMQMKQLKLKPSKKTATVDSTVIVESNSFEEQNKKESNIKAKWSVSPSSESELKEVSIRSDEQNDSLKLLISSDSIRKEGLITDLVQNNFYIKFNNLHSSFLNIVLSSTYQDHYKVTVIDHSNVELFFKKPLLDDLNSKNLTAKFEEKKIKYTICSPVDKFIYWPCKLISKSSVNHDTYLFTFLLPPGTKMWIPIGCHLQLKLIVKGFEIIRNYTPVCAQLKTNCNSNSQLEGSTVILMVKIYSSGTLTTALNRFNLGENVYVSNYVGNFSEAFIENSNSIVMIAAGTGITPMLRIIQWAIADKHVKRSLQLLFFNKTENDILWKNELEDCRLSYKEFQIDNILSAPGKDWNGCIGQINGDILAQLIKVNPAHFKQRFLICGPLPFTHAAVSYLKEMKYNEDDFYAFTGS